MTTQASQLPAEISNTIDEADLKYRVQEYISEADRFRCLDESFLPIELDHMKDSYIYIMIKLGKMCHQTAKYQHTCENYKKHIETEIRAISRLESEIKELEHSAEVEKEEAMKFADEIKTKAEFIYDNLIASPQPVKEVLLSFEAFFSLAIPNAFDGHFNWAYVIEMLKDRKGLSDAMIGGFDRRVSEISRSEIEKVVHLMKKFRQEFSIRNSKHEAHVVAVAMHNYVESFIDVYDFLSSARARRDLRIMKAEKLDFLRKEIASYRKIRDDSEEQVEELVNKYRRSKIEYDLLKEEEMKGESALQEFDYHLKELERKKNEGKLTAKDAEEALDRLKEDTMEMNRITIKVAYTVPPDTSFA